ncbi:hypothetical protein BBW65_07070 [Helicobacter enhydrae]|uniref:Phosphoadenosine phosphosulphate reductase domain-containing protein n=1 Tax=Helicobacter enhydrae TaxID=222136 RepID=A0A1B1U6B2_9HELI|nr:phosphoadenosine phosphosulfate reductase family protein [Helicobacter enhydrae]ANV98299.1 hypothetical protein BBW65_05575 [Helicobacter enhydrae]ANV98569.1 hypothetical protein BBW65_07070 [Helicobacter enhydrae]
MFFANLSGGRDSTAMVIRWLELGKPLDFILFCDTGYEFPQMHDYIQKLDSYLQKEFNKQITKIDKTKEIEHWSFAYPITRGEHKGKLRGLPKMLGPSFCTRETKAKPSKEFILSQSPQKFKNNILIGYTYDEVEKGRVSNLDYGISIYPLHQWKWNEKEIDVFLKKRQLFNPLYNHFQRTGCFFCPKQSKKSLFTLWKYYPELYQIALDMEKRAKELNCINQTFKPKSLLEYAKEFAKEFQYAKEFQTPDIALDHQNCFCGK